MFWGYLGEGGGCFGEGGSRAGSLGRGGGTFGPIDHEFEEF